MKSHLVKHTLQAFVALLATGMFAQSQAAPINPAISFASPQGDLNAGTFSLGFAFAPNSAISVNQLGIFDDGTNAGSVHAVGIFDAQGDLLTSTDITQGTGLINFFDWASINPLSLSAGHTYYIAETTGTSNYAFANFPFMTVNPEITFVGSAFTESTVLAFPMLSPGFGYFGPNFSIAVPEPPSLPMLLAGLGLLGAFYFGRKRTVTS